MTIGQSVYDLLARLGMNSDDSDVSYRLAANWLDQARAKVVKEYVERHGDELPPSMLKRYKCTGVTKTSSACEDCYEFTLDLDVEVMDLRDDIGVYALLRPGGKPVRRLGTVGALTTLQNTRYGLKEYWYRVEDAIVVVGKFPLDIKFTVIVVVNEILSLEPDEEFPAPDDVMVDILALAEEIGRRMIGTPQDLNNDGKSLTHG